MICDFWRNESVLGYFTCEGTFALLLGNFWRDLKDIELDGFVGEIFFRCSSKLNLILARKSFFWKRDGDTSKGGIIVYKN